MIVYKTILLLIVSCVFTLSVSAQDFRTDAYGDARIIGKLDLHEELDTSIVIIGYKAGNKSQQFNTGGGDINTTLVGSNSGENLTLGTNNTFFGNEAGRYCDSTFFNSFFGSSAGLVNRGIHNSYFGFGVGANNREGRQNSFFGSNSGNLNETGSFNTFFGYATGLNNSEGSHNTYVGNLTGLWNELGSFNTFIGSESGGPQTNDSIVGSIAIGFGSRVDCNHCATIGSEGANAVNVGIGESNPESVLHIKQKVIGPTGGFRIDLPNIGSWNMYLNNSAKLNFALNGNRLGFIDEVSGDYMATSDMLLKTDISGVESVIDDVMKLNPVWYHFKRNGEEDPRTLGFLAQDIQKLFPELVSESEEGLGLAYSKLSVVALKAIQEQQDIIKTQQKAIQSLSAKLTSIERQLEELR